MKIPKELYIDQFEFVPLNSEDELEIKLIEFFNSVEIIYFQRERNCGVIIFTNTVNNTYNPYYENYHNCFSLSCRSLIDLYEKQRMTGMYVAIYDREKAKIILGRIFKTHLDFVV